MANQKSDFDYLTWILSHDFVCVDKEWMKEEKAAVGKKPQVVRINKGRGVKGYELYEFGNKENCRHLPFFNHTNNHPVIPDAPKGLIAFCDYIILAEFKDTLYVLLIELKRGTTSHAKVQLEASKMFMDYILNSAERIKRANSMEQFDIKNVEFRKIILSYSSKETLNSHFPSNMDKNDIINYNTGSYFDIREVI